MDESERRRERLKAMRNEAARGEATSANQAQVQSGLANPLTDASPLQELPRSAPRFDYYTDPMASFSGNRKGFVNNHGPRCISPNPGYVRPPPVRQMLPHPEPWNPTITVHPRPGPRVYQGGGGPFNGSFPNRTPFGLEHPYLPNHDLPPGVGNQSSSAVSYHLQPNFARGANFPNSGIQSDFSLGRSRGRSFQGSHSGRGRGNWAENKVRMGSQQNSSRNQGSASPTSKSLYDKSMVDDPWKSLKPSLWREENPDTSLPSPKTVGMKRPLEVSGPSQSLAEYLADSFDEAVKGDPDA